MKCHISDILRHTTAMMGMALPPPPAIPGHGCFTDIREAVKQNLITAATTAITDADAMMLAPGLPVRTMLAWPGGCEGHGMALMPLPEDCLRLVDVKLSDWKRPATIITQDSPAYLMQMSDFTGVRGNPENPVAAICRRPAGLVAELFSSREGRGVCIDFAQYIPVPRFSPDGFVFLPDRLYQDIISATARLSTHLWSE